MAKVYISFPKTGLGNMLLVWAKGMVFAKINNLTAVTSSWWGLHWGALLRRERKNRLYYGYFKETPFATQLLFKCRSLFFKVEKEPSIALVTEDRKALGKLFVFDTVITNPDLFAPLRNYEKLVKEMLHDALSVKMKEKLIHCEAPVVGMHIRRGDFKISGQQTDLSYFIEAVNIIRAALQREVSVTVFTDAEKDELAALVELNNISLAADKPDILDILQLAKSRILVLSKSSSFGYWAAFLSSAFVVLPHNDWQKMIKEQKTGDDYFEFRWNPEAPSSGNEMAALLRARLKEQIY